MAKKKIIRKSNKTLNLYSGGGFASFMNNDIAKGIMQGMSSQGGGQGQGGGYDGMNQLVGSIEGLMSANQLPLADKIGLSPKRLYAGGGAMGGGAAGIGGMVDTGLSLISQGIDNSKIAETAGLKKDITSYGNTKSSSSTNDELMSEWESAGHLEHIKAKDLKGGNLGTDFLKSVGASAQGASSGMSAGPIGGIVGAVVGGVSSLAGSIAGRVKAKNEAKRINKQTDVANERKLVTLEDKAMNLDTQNDLNALANFSAYGGPIDIFGGGAIDYQLASEDAKNKELDTMSKYRLVSMPNSFQALPEMSTSNAFAEGGGLGTGIKENVATAASFLPVVGTIMDGAELIANPSLENAGWFLGGLASDIFTGGTGRAALKGVKSARKAAKAAKALKEKRLEAALRRGNKSYSTSMRSYRKAKGLESKANQEMRKEVGKITGIEGADILQNTTQQNTKAMGGPLTHGGVFSNGVTVIRNGGTHEENPIQGVPMGIDNEGVPNLVEEGEVKFNDYIFSNRLFADGGLLATHNLPTSYADHSFADIAERLSKESSERPNDPISKRGLMSSMTRLQQAQEELKANETPTNTFARGGRMCAGGGPLGIDPELLEEEEDYFYPTGSKLYGTPYDDDYVMPIGNTQDSTTKVGNTQDSTTEDSKKKNSKENKGDWKTWLRYAPAAASGIATLTDAFGWTNQPDYSNADLIGNAIDVIPNAEFTPVGNYLAYNPLDRNYYINKLNAQAGATRRAIVNQSGGNRATAMAGLLAADYNAQGQLGDLARQAEEYNLAQRERVEGFNRQTNLSNSQMGLQAAGMNQEAASRRLSGRIAQAQMREQISGASNAAKSANMNNFIDSLGDIGREEFARNMIESNPANYYTTDNQGHITYKKGYEELSDEEKKAVQSQAEKEADKKVKAEKKAKEKANKKANKKAKGGYLTIRKKK